MTTPMTANSAPHGDHLPLASTLRLHVVVAREPVGRPRRTALLDGWPPLVTIRTGPADVASAANAVRAARARHASATRVAWRWRGRRPASPSALLDWDLGDIAPRYPTIEVPERKAGRRPRHASRPGLALARLVPLAALTALAALATSAGPVPDVTPVRGVHPSSREVRRPLADVVLRTSCRRVPRGRPLCVRGRRFMLEAFASARPESAGAVPPSALARFTVTFPAPGRSARCRRRRCGTGGIASRSVVAGGGRWWPVAPSPRERRPRATPDPVRRSPRNRGGHRRPRPGRDAPVPRHAHDTLPERAYPRPPPQSPIPGPCI